jgi:hypothetical protein
MTSFIKTVIECTHPDLGVGNLYTTKHLAGHYKNLTSFRFFPEDRSRGALYVKAQYGVPENMGFTEVGTPKELKGTHPISNMSHCIALKPADQWKYSDKSNTLKVPVRCPHDSNKWTMELKISQWYGFIPFDIFRDKYHGCTFHADVQSYYRSAHGRKAHQLGQTV